MVTALSSLFGILATMLAIIGLYGVMAYMVTRRSREIGIRMALGAMRGNVVWLVIRELLVLVGVGIAIGLPAAFGLTRLVESQLYGVKANDPAAMLLATMALATVSLLAGYIPARRAAGFDPVRVLRYELGEKLSLDRDCSKRSMRIREGHSSLSVPGDNRLAPLVR